MRAYRKLLLAVFFSAVFVSACSASGDAPNGTASEIASNIFAEAGVEPFGGTVSIDTEESMEYYLGSTNYPPFTDSAVVEPMINIDARILYVLIVESAGDAADVVAQLEVDVDPSRLICVSFAMEDVVIDSRDNVVFMVIDSDHAERDALAAGFATID